MKKNDVITLTVTGLSSEGDGVGRHDGMAVFVPGAAAGDVCEVTVIKVLSNRAVGRLRAVTVPSPDRVENDCPVFPACGGCNFRHISYAAEQNAKFTSVCEALRRIGGTEPPAHTRFLGAGRTDGYRNKALYPLAAAPYGTEFGFYRRGTHTVVPCRRRADGARVPCALQPEVFSRAAETVAAWLDEHGVPVYDETTGRGVARAVFLRRAEATGELMVCLVAASRRLPDPAGLIEALKAQDIGFSTLVLNVNPDRTNTVLGRECVTLYGPGTVTETLCGVRLTVSPLSFFQVNRAQCEALYGEGRAFLREAMDGRRPRLLDLYCGVGSIALAFAADCEAVFGIEIVPDAVENARANAAANGIGNASFACGDAASAPALLAGKGFAPDAVTVDPPRKGLSADVIAYLRACGAGHVVYFSCEPSTLARDVRLLSGDFALTRLSAADMFPRTANVESVALLTRIRPGE